MLRLANRARVAACFLIVLTSSGAALTAEPPRVGPGRGVLATASSREGPWKMLRQGDLLDDACHLRTGPTGAASIECATGTLVVAANAELKLRHAERTVELRRGTVYLAVNEDAVNPAWQVIFGTRTIQLTPGSSVEIAATTDEPLTASIVEGQASIATGDANNLQIVGAPRRFVAAPEHSDRMRRLTSDEVEGIKAWAEGAARGQGPGQLVIADAQSGQTRRLNIARYHVNIVLQPPVALVQVDQAFYNDSSRVEEGTFVFNLPPSASVSRFAMWTTPEQLVEGELLERKRAALVYDRIVHRRRDPAILEQIGDQLFKMRVFPVAAHDAKRILLDYTLPLVADDEGIVHFQLPLLSDLEPIWDFEITCSIQGARLPAQGLEGAIVSASHPNLALNRHDDGTVDFRLAQQAYQPTSDLLLAFRQDVTNEISVRSDRSRHVGADERVDESTYFAATVRPRGDVVRPPPADVLILADTSSSIGDRAAVRRMAGYLIDQLGERDQFQLGCVDVNYRPLVSKWTELDETAARSAAIQLDKEVFLGATALEASLRAALDQFETSAPERRRIVIYIGDGQESMRTRAKDRRHASLTAMLKQAGATFFAVRVGGSDSDDSLLDAVCAATHGSLFDANTSRTGERELVGWLLAGMPPSRVVESVKLFDPAQGQELDASNDDLLYVPVPGSRRAFQILGRTAKTGKLELRVTTLQEEGDRLVETWPISIDAEAKDVFVGRLWAQRKIESLWNAEPAPGWQRERIVELSQEWSLLSPSTAFLVMKDEWEYYRWEIDPAVRRRYWKPAEALAQISIPAGWRRPGAMTGERATDEPDFATLLQHGVDRAKAALDRGAFSEASFILQELSENPLAADSEDYRLLSHNLRSQLERQSLLTRLGAQRDLFLPRRPRLASSPADFAAGTTRPALASEYLAAQPHAEALLREVDASAIPTALTDFADWLWVETRVPVVLDNHGIESDEDARYGARFAADLYFRGRMTLRNAAYHLLLSRNLVLVDEPDRLLITSRSASATKLRAIVYPVADLFRTDRVAESAQLLSPLFDQEQLARHRIQEKLAVPRALDLNDTTFEVAMERLAETLGGNVVVNRAEIDAQSQPVTLKTKVRWEPRDLPLETNLRWMLEPLDLDYVIQHEALIITTTVDAQTMLETRLHSARGVVVEYAQSISGSFPIWGGGMGGGYFGGSGGFDRDAPQEGEADTGFVVTVTPAREVEAAPSDPPETRIPAGGDGSATGLDDPKTNDGPDANVPHTARWAIDRWSGVEMIEETLTAEPGWADDGGAGTIELFAPTLDFVISTTAPRHDEIDAMLARLRALPSDAQGVPRAYLPPPRSLSLTVDADLEELAEIVPETIMAETWSDNGGYGSITAHTPGLALVISHSPEVHQHVWDLFVQLRRSRHESLEHDRPWVAWSQSGRLPLLHGRGISEFRAHDPGAADGEATAEELALLAARRAGDAGRWKWRRTATGIRAAETVSLSRSGDRLELNLPSCTLLADKDEGAAHYPGLALVELGSWGDAVRGLADEAFPWLPQRSNDELARLFLIEPVPAEVSPDAKAAPRVRLRHRATWPEEGTYLVASWSSDTGLPTIWESYIQGSLISRIEFTDLGEAAGLPVWQTVTQYDAKHEPLCRWELLEADAEARDIPPAAERWPECMRFDRHLELPHVDPEFHLALAALAASDWSEADRQIVVALRQRPNQPLLLFLKAWCHARRSLDVDTQTVAIEELGIVAASDAVELTRLIGRDLFPFVSDEDYHRLLQRQPEVTRTAADLERLARAAKQVGLPEQALAHISAALDPTRGEPRNFDRELLRLELLLQLASWAKGVAAAQAVADDAASLPDELAQMANALARAEQPREADALLAQAIAHPRAMPWQQLQYTLRRAALTSRMPRYRLLLAAAEQFPKAPRTWSQHALDLLLRELYEARDALAAAQLDEVANGDEAHVALRLCRAELTDGVGRKGELAAELLKSRQIPADKLAWCLQCLNAAGRYQETIAEVERMLRADMAVSFDLQQTLASAYHAVGRDADALRASTEDRR